MNTPATQSINRIARLLEAHEMGRDMARMNKPPEDVLFMREDEHTAYWSSWRAEKALMHAEAALATGHLAAAEDELDAEEPQPCLWTWVLSLLGGWSRERREFYKQGRK